MIRSGNVGVFFAFRLIDIRKDDQSLLLERNDDVSSWEERIVDSRHLSLFLSFSLDKRASCNLRNRFPSSYYIVSPERGVIHRGGKVGQEMWSVCGGLYRPTPNLLLICCVDNGANGMILSKPVCVYIYICIIYQKLHGQFRLFESNVNALYLIS